MYLQSFINQIQDINCKVNGQINERDVFDFFRTVSFIFMNIKIVK